MKSLDNFAHASNITLLDTQNGEIKLHSSIQSMLLVCLISTVFCDTPYGNIDVKAPHAE